MSPPAAVPLPSRAPVYVGTAGWSLPPARQPCFPAEGTHLQRYAARLPAVEINSSFHRPHRASTYARWAASVPAGFRFSAKLPRTITHDARLAGTEALLDRFFGEVEPLGAALGCVLVQLPPSLGFDGGIADAFFRAVRERFAGPVACEPRHASWFAEDAGHLLAGHEAARVAADPARVEGAGEPGGWPGLVYHRLHGSPRMYYSDYDAAYLDALTARLDETARRGVPAWCIFDNTALGAAAGNALALLQRLTAGGDEG